MPAEKEHVHSGDHRVSFLTLNCKSFSSGGASSKEPHGTRRHAVGFGERAGGGDIRCAVDRSFAHADHEELAIPRNPGRARRSSFTSTSRRISGAVGSRFTIVSTLNEAEPRTARLMRLDCAHVLLPHYGMLTSALPLLSSGVR